MATICKRCNGMVSDIGGHTCRFPESEQPNYGGFRRRTTSFESFWDEFDVTLMERNRLVDHLKLIRNEKLDRLKTPTTKKE